MYAAIPAVDLAIAAAEGPGGEVLRDRLRFVPFFEAAERHAHARGMVVGGEAATLLLTGAPLGPSDYFYELHSGDALADARALTDACYALDPEGLGRYASMATSVPRKEFQIVVDERALFRVKALATHQGADVAVPSVRPARFARAESGEPLQLLCMGPEVQLVAVYAALADPGRASDWPALLETEAELRALFEQEASDGKLLAAASGGGRPAAAALVAALAAEYVPQAGHALVGSRAVAELTASPPRGGGRLQLVSANAFRDEEAAVRRIATRLGFRVQSSTNSPRVPTDDRLRRMTMFVVWPDKRREPFLDVFDAGAYQLVAFSGGDGVAGGGRGGRQRPRRRPPVGSPFTVMRFLLVDAWTIQLLLRMEAVSARYARQVLREVLAGFRAVAAAYLGARERGAFGRIFPAESLGRREDPVVAQKRRRYARQHQKKPKGRRTFFPPYFPAAKKKEG